MAFGPPSLLHIGAVALIEGIAMVFYNLAEVAALPRVVAKEQLPHATAANHAGHSAAIVAGPALGTWLYQGLWRGMPFVADALSYAASAWMLLRLRADFAPRGPVPERRDLRAEVAEGLRWLWHQRLVRLIALLTSGINFVHASMPILLIVIAKQQGASEVAIGLVFSIGGIGGLLGALVGPWARARFSFGQAVIGATLVQALLFPFFALATSTLWLGAIYAAIMFFAPIYNVVQLSYRVALIPDGLQGRVNSGFRFTAHLLYPVGALLCGVLIEHAGAMPALAVFAACYLALAAALASRQIRRAV
ncbi:MAG: MFS transporter [Burkholderiales bacterium]|nr:MFS transporter [Burkholderiales bacterium]